MSARQRAHRRVEDNWSGPVIYDSSYLAMTLPLSLFARWQRTACFSVWWWWRWWWWFLAVFYHIRFIPVWYPARSQQQRITIIVNYLHFVFHLYYSGPRLAVNCYPNRHRHGIRISRKKQNNDRSTRKCSTPVSWRKDTQASKKKKKKKKRKKASIVIEQLYYCGGL